tara:strand:- start:815 stop:946 length:132 start_codon:yes stop_codon:yes gene_type:complete
MKCPECKQEGFGIIKLSKKNMYDYKKREKALFGCDECGHREVI